MTSPIPRIALTPGEPAGIGPDLCTRIGGGLADAELVLIADRGLLMERARMLGNDLAPVPFNPNRAGSPQAGRVCIHHHPLAVPAQPGRLNPRNAQYVLKTLESACNGCLDGRFSALVTGPVHKGVINEAGVSFTGHTEFLAELCGDQPVMMLTAPGLRVALVTTHLPLSQVSGAITPQRLESIIRTLHRELVQRFGVVSPRILVCGLNPHAGEGGHLGREELEIIEPVLQRLRAEDIDLCGPLPADTLFTPRYLKSADAVLAMYHDQGLPVLKHMGFGRAVNVTLGLPIIRTSVDHGTALELAGSGRAEPGSLEAALKAAVEMSQRGEASTVR